ncbi:hypothetical protein ACIGFL_22170 [Pseudomonas sp. NPDC077649]|uniref:hypothetical protein n=1 Tax=Pseudomonas sp. NPDC077649 TaxID=3364423 RepID=UPI0037C99AF6
MHSPLRSLSLSALGLVLVVLAGCEAAEQSAQKLVEETEQQAQALLDDAVGEAVEQLNKQVDRLQESANQALGKPAQEESAEQPEAEPDAAAGEGFEPGVET